MRIGFDAYFAFHYKTGVAHYGRNLINSIAKFYPETELVLFTDVVTNLYQPGAPNITIIELGYEVAYHQWLSHPELTRHIHGQNIDIFHGLDHGLPSLSGIKQVVTIHDLFFETHPALYAAADVEYYRMVAPLACEKADAIISISAFTKKDLIGHYHADAKKISVCYQSCNPLFFQQVTEERKDELRDQFQLPSKFWLYVGSVIARKNLLNICKALNEIKERSSTPLMVIGEGSDYLEEVQQYIQQNNLAERIRFISYTDAAGKSASFQQAKDVPAFYQMAFGLLYPSYLEGFGIPLIEAFASGLPVITSNTSSLPEVGGDAALFVDPFNVNDIASAMMDIENDASLRFSMIQKGNNIAQHFTEEQTASSVMKVYKQLS